MAFGQPCIAAASTNNAGLINGLLIISDITGTRGHFRFICYCSISSYSCSSVTEPIVFSTQSPCINSISRCEVGDAEPLVGIPKLHHAIVRAYCSETVTTIYLIIERRSTLQSPHTIFILLVEIQVFRMSTKSSAMHNTAIPLRRTHPRRFLIFFIS